MLLRRWRRLRAWPFELAREHDARRRDPFIEPFVELVPMHEKLEPLLGRLWLLGFDPPLAGGVRVRRFVADGEDLSEAFFNLAVGVFAADEDLAAY